MVNNSCPLYQIYRPTVTQTYKPKIDNKLKIPIYTIQEIENRYRKGFPVGDNLSPNSFRALECWCYMISNKALYILTNVPLCSAA